MYEVRWEIDGKEFVETLDSQTKAMKLYEDIRDDGFAKSSGVYYTDGDGNEKELASWSW